MERQQLKALEAAYKIYNTLPNYLFQKQDKRTINILLLDLINALDILEFEENGEPFFDAFKDSPRDIRFDRKKAVLGLMKDFNLTEREAQILAYLGNGRNPTYISEVLEIAKATAKAHKYSIYKKLNVHSTNELKDLLNEYEKKPR